MRRLINCGKKSVWQKLRLAGFGLAAAVGVTVETAHAQLLFSENFDSLPRMGSVNERLGFPSVTRVATDPNSAPISNAFTHVGPAGWVVDNSLGTYNGSPTIGNAGVPGAGLPNYGVDEWEGWSFAHKSFWTTADTQGRETFNLGQNVVAVADADEYFDLGDSDDPVNGGYYNTGLKSPAIPVATGNLYSFKFDSSWRDEALDDDYGPNPALNNTNNQAVEVLAIYNDPGGTVQQRLVWNSDPASPTFKNDAQNETLSFNFGVPAGATAVSFQFNYANAANDWWWAIDNLEVTNLSAGGASVWSENFDGVALGDSVNERRSTVPSKLTAVEGAPNSASRPDSFTNVPPAGWTIDNSGLPAGTVGRDDKGVYEWEGWNFATLDFWKFADTQRREEFTKCVGNCAIADSDEWTDLGGPGGPMDTLLTTPTISIAGIGAGTLRVSFDSSWRDEDDQVALLEVSYDGGAWLEALRWESHDKIDDGMGGTIPNPKFHDDNPNETVLLSLANPGGAQTAQFRFSYLGGNNNWWWAIDNLQVSAVPEPSTCGLMILAVANAVFFRGRNRRAA